MRHIILCFILLVCINSYAQQVYLGIYVEDLNQIQLKSLGIPSGIIIETVMPGSPADIYGLFDNDIITKINNTTIKNEKDLTRFLFSCKPNDIINITTLQQKRYVVRTVKLSERENLYKDLYIFNYIHNPWLFVGINVEPLSATLAKVLMLEMGMVILDVRDNSLAQIHGFEAGDIIISVNGISTFSEKKLTDAMNLALQSQLIKFYIWRDSKYHDMSIDLGNSLSEESHDQKEVFIVGPDIFDNQLYNYSRDKIDRLLKKSKKEIEADIERLENEIYNLRQRMNNE
ncbi:MAG: PDZ domain-containing protein [Candidatus Cloacimonetes bacterium]|nr:PDZ domain-containing protein [Candidatus Cloacimonadota bacterium]